MSVPDATIPSMTWCELCDMERSWCEHGRQDLQRRKESSTLLLVSPRGMVHFEGCPHKDDPDFSRCARLPVEGAWQELGNGRTYDLQDASGGRLVANSRCSDCVDHGPWD